MNPHRATAMILAAGFGTRLRPLTQALPKPAVWLGDRRVIDHIEEQLRNAGANVVVANGHHCGEVIRQWAIAEPARRRATLETEILGTAGGVAHAAPALGRGPRLVVNGDILATTDFGQLWAAFDQDRVYACLAVYGEQAPGVGTVGLDAAGQVVRLRDLNLGGEVLSGDFVGTQILSAEARDGLPSVGCLVGDGYMPALARGESVRALHCVERFVDIGTPEAYLEANLHWLNTRSKYVAADANIAEGVHVSQSIVGAGATVTGTGRLDRVVVWPGAHAESPLSDAVVLDDGTVWRCEP